jgi:hypothetical protein
VTVVHVEQPSCSRSRPHLWARTCEATDLHLDVTCEQLNPAEGATPNALVPRRTSGSACYAGRRR